MTRPALHDRMRSLCACACASACIAGVALLGQSAAAQTKPGAASVNLPPLSSSLTGQAKADYDAARILIGDQDFPGALVKFQQAFALAGDVRLLWNMAVCEKNLRHYAGVLRLLERYQREGDANMSQAHRAEVAEVVATVRMLISTVWIEVNQPGASIFVDDRLAGTTPLAEPVLVDLGKRRIRISKPGFIAQTVTQDFGGGSEVTQSFTLRPQPRDARLTISADGPGTISIDGKVVGERYWSGAVPGGEHALRITAPGKQPYVKEVTLQPGQSRTLHITLAPEKSSIPTFVWIGAGVVAASGLATGAYFLLRDAPSTSDVYVGTLPPGTIPIR